MAATASGPAPAMRANPAADLAMRETSEGVARSRPRHSPTAWSASPGAGPGIALNAAIMCAGLGSAIAWYERAPARLYAAHLSQNGASREPEESDARALMAIISASTRADFAACAKTRPRASAAADILGARAHSGSLMTRRPARCAKVPDDGSVAESCRIMAIRPPSSSSSVGPWPSKTVTLYSQQAKLRGPRRHPPSATGAA